MSRARESYIRFVELPPLPSGKTKKWRVEAVDGDVPLGVVSWFGRWRCYSFSPARDTIFERKCLRDIANFLEHQTADHREGLKVRRRA